jgi:mono/diheme cytochrome c family protein
MFQARCGGCHNSDKRESGLDLTAYDTAMRGGEDGKVIVKGDTEQSDLLRRISLPPDDDEFMPAEHKTPLTDRQVAIIRWWIAAGAPSGVTIGTLEVPAETQALLSAELGVTF